MVNKNVYKDTQVRSSEMVVKELSQLREYSKQNNINEVNNCVDSLLKNPEFWILCYENIEPNFNVTSPIEKAVIMDNINLDFFHKLSSNISKGRFNFVIVDKVNSSKSFGSVDFRDKIVLQGITVLLEELSEHRFLDCSFGFRKKKSCHDAIMYIKKKVPLGV